MVKVKLADGSERELGEKHSVFDLAKSISNGLAKGAVAGFVNEKLVDLSHKLKDGDKVTIYTKKDPESLEVLRHSAAHLMADAILRLFSKGRAYNWSSSRGWILL